MTYNPHTAPIASARQVVAEGGNYWSVISAARFHERMQHDKLDKSGKLTRKGNPASAILARRLRALATEVAALTGFDVRKYRGRRPANDNKRRLDRRAAA